MNPFSSSKIIASLTSILLYALIIFDVIGDFSYLFQVTNYLVTLLLSMKCASMQKIFTIFFLQREYFGYQGIFDASQRHYSQLVYIGVCWVYLLLMNWQHEYMHRLDYQVLSNFLVSAQFYNML